MTADTPTTIDDVHPAQGVERFEGGMRLAGRQFVRNRAATLGFVCLALICLMAVLAPFVAPYDPVQIKLSAKLQPPGSEFRLGTDRFGRDVLSRLVWGARVSLSVGLIVVAFAVSLGVPVGLLSGFIGGRLDNLLMRVMDAFLNFPPLLLAVAIGGLLGRNSQDVINAHGIVQAPGLPRLFRGSPPTLCKETHVRETRALRASSPRIVLRHVLRNILPPNGIHLTIVFSAAVIAEASL